MRPLAAVERFFERLFERPTARLFRARIQPVQIERRIERSMEAMRRPEAGRPSVPDRYMVRVHPVDLAGLAPVTNLPVDLASSALEFARRRGYVLASRPRVALVADDGLDPGDVEVEVRFSDPSDGIDLDAASAASAAGLTRVFEVPVVRGPRTSLLVSEPNRARRTIAIEGGTLAIGRDASNDLALADPRASRRHARLTSRDGVLVLTDLGSTNGTRVNGRTVRELAVGEDDRIEIGDSVLVVAALPDAGPTADVGGRG